MIVGVDPSYARTGIATTGDTRSLTPPSALTGGHPLRRATRRRAWLRGTITPLIRGADLVAVEGMYPTTEYGAIDRAELLGAIVDLVWSTGDAGILVVAPASPKILATGNGGPATDKAAMLTAARAAGSPATNGDEADAWWICELARLLVDPWHRVSESMLGTGLQPYPPHRARALDPYRPPWTTDHPSPWIRHPLKDGNHAP